MEPYVEAVSLQEAEQVLDRLARGGEVPADVVGDCYDDLAEAAANEKDFASAVRLERKALESFAARIRPMPICSSASAMLAPRPA